MPASVPQRSVRIVLERGHSGTKRLLGHVHPKTARSGAEPDHQDLVDGGGQRVREQGELYSHLGDLHPHLQRPFPVRDRIQDPRANLLDLVDHSCSGCGPRTWARKERLGIEPGEKDQRKCKTKFPLFCWGGRNLLYFVDQIWSKRGSKEVLPRYDFSLKTAYPGDGIGGCQKWRYIRFSREEYSTCFTLHQGGDRRSCRGHQALSGFQV